MGFTRGHKFSPGRPKGSKNKRTIEFQEVLQEHDFNVAESLIWCFQQAKERYEDYKERFQSNRISPMEDNGPKYLKIAADMAKEMASYSYPKLKSLDQTIAAHTETGFKVIVEDYTVRNDKDKIKDPKDPK